MDLTPYVDGLGRELVALLETGDAEARALVERLAASLDSAIRLTLLESLSAAADEITRDLAPGSVELRLRGREPGFVVTPPPAATPTETEAEPALPAFDDSGPAADEGATTRINLRLPETLKAAIEEAAGREGRSVNAWIVRAASAALRQPSAAEHTETRGKRGSQHFTGWVR